MAPASMRVTRLMSTSTARWPPLTAVRSAWARCWWLARSNSPAALAGRVAVGLGWNDSARHTVNRIVHAPSFVVRARSPDNRCVGGHPLPVGVVPLSGWRPVPQPAMTRNEVVAVG
jgi:hypothetical protein